MKKVLRNDLGLMMIAWCLFLNGYSLLGVSAALIASIYCIVYISNKNGWRILALSLITFALSYYVLKNCYLFLFDFSTFFVASVTLNVCLLNERLCKERLSTLYISFIICFVCFFIFSLIALIVPVNNFIPFLKSDMYSLIMLVFIPYTSEMMIHLFYKEIRRQRFLNKLKEKTTSPIL